MAIPAGFRFGTPRQPGADLARLPIGLDVKAVRLAEGIRAALASALVIMADTFFHQPTLIYMALAAFFTCLCDTGGPIPQRFPRPVCFTIVGACLWSGFGLLRAAPLPIVVGLATLGIFCTSFARIWGDGATAVGNILSVVLILSLDEPLQRQQALEIFSLFIAGGLWATVLMLVIWRLHPYQQTRNALSEVWDRLADLSEDLLGLMRSGASSQHEWEAHARAYRRAVRETLEHARRTIMETVGMRGQLSLRASQALLRLEIADQLFGVLIGLSHLLETDASPTRREAALRLLRLLRPMLTVLSRAMRADTPVDLAKIERALQKMLAATTNDPALGQFTTRMADKLRNVAKLSTAEGYRPGGPLTGAAATPLLPRMWDPIRANLTWDSEMFRHALRTALIACLTLAGTLYWEAPFVHWMTITVVVTLQPFYAATWQRALERVGGTVLGGLFGSLLALITHTPVLLAGLMIPLYVIAFSVRQVSFGTFIACITPIIIVLMELIHPGYASWEVAGLRALFTILGGAVAIIGWMLLWPSWEPDRLRTVVRGGIAAHAAFAKAALAELIGEGDSEAVEAARRQAGVATNNVEASLTRALQEPERGAQQQLDVAMVVDATLRRIAGQLSIIRHDPETRVALAQGGIAEVRDWIVNALEALSRGEMISRAGRPEKLPEAIARLTRQIDLMANALGRVASVPV